MRTRLFIILLLYLLLPDVKIRTGYPGDIIPQKKMQAVLWDMMRADQFLTDFVFNKDSALIKERKASKLYRQVFAIHHISKEEFEKSFSYYKAHPVLLKVIMDSLSQPKAEAPTEMINQPILGIVSTIATEDTIS